jgi:hypothetical protein
VESSLQLTEQLSVHVMWQVEASVQVTLPLAPTVTSQVDPPLQSTLHDAPHSPVHSFWSVQATLQLSPSQSVPDRSQELCAGQLQLVPVHSSGSDSPPQAPRNDERITSKAMRIW